MVFLFLFHLVTSIDFHYTGHYTKCIDRNGAASLTRQQCDQIAAQRGRTVATASWGPYGCFQQNSNVYWGTSATESCEDLRCFCLSDSPVRTHRTLYCGDFFQHSDNSYEKYCFTHPVDGETYCLGTQSGDTVTCSYYANGGGSWFNERITFRMGQFDDRVISVNKIGEPIKYRWMPSDKANNLAQLLGWDSATTTDKGLYYDHAPCPDTCSNGYFDANGNYVTEENDSRYTLYADGITFRMTETPRPTKAPVLDPTLAPSIEPIEPSMSPTLDPIRIEFSYQCDDGSLPHNSGCCDADDRCPSSCTDFTIVPGATGNTCDCKTCSENNANTDGGSNSKAMYLGVAFALILSFWMF